MKKTTAILLLLSLLLALSGCAKGKNTKVCPEIPVGVLVGAADSVDGNMQKLGYEMALQEFNANSESTVCPIKLIYAEEGVGANLNSSQNILLSLADQGVVALIGANSNEASMQAAAITRNLEIPLVIPRLSADELTKTDNQWVFRMSASSEAEAKTAVSLVQAQLGNTAKFAVLYESSAFGENAAVHAANAILDSSMELAYYQKYPSASTGFSEQLAEIKAAEVDVLYFIANLPGPARAMMGSLQLTSIEGLQVITAGNGFTSSEFQDVSQGALSYETTKLLILSPWNDDLPWKPLAGFLTVYRQFSSERPGVLPAVPPVGFAEAYASLNFLANSINLTMTDASVAGMESLKDAAAIATFREAVRQSLRSQFNRPETILGVISLDALGQNALQPLVLQYSDGELQTVYPLEIAKKEIIFQHSYQN
jgi:branched-chain amino acid transport system substrate-binding protein